jgi:hypothetical protein
VKTLGWTKEVKEKRKIRSRINLREHFTERYEFVWPHSLHKHTSEVLHATVHINLISNTEYDTINT